MMVLLVAGRVFFVLLPDVWDVVRMLFMRTQVHKRCQEPERTEREIAEKFNGFSC